MTRKDYIAIAEIIRKSREDKCGLLFVERKLIEYFQSDNPLFNVNYFLSATASRPTAERNL